MRSSDEEFRSNVLSFINRSIEEDDRYRRAVYPHHAVSYDRLRARFGFDQKRLDFLLVRLVREGELIVSHHPARADLGGAEIVGHYRLPGLLERIAFAAR